MVNSQIPVSGETQYGPIEGFQFTFQGNTITRYLGIPYAKPPTGERRFLPPEEPEPWTDILMTKNHSNSCVQVGAEYSNLIIGPDEDCLYLNVYVPERQGNLPVMVWIHGGSLTTGSASAYRPETMAIVGEVILVSINYRLDVFGFLATGDDLAEGNAGLMDQTLALKWVKNNIAGFGGDADKITIFGESAGGWSVSMHIISPMSQGLFHRAICESGSMHGFPLDTQEERGVATVRLAEKLLCPTNNKLQMFECLQQVDKFELLARANDVGDDYFTFYPPSTGDRFLPQHPDVYWDDLANHPSDSIDLMMGFNSDEGLLFFMLGVPTEDAHYTEVDDYLMHGVTTDDPLYDGAAYYALQTLSPGSYPVPSNPVWRVVEDQYLPDETDPIQNMRGLLNIVADTMFLSPTMKTLQKMSDAGHNCYLYYFDQVLPLSHTNGSVGLRFFFPTVNPDLYFDILSAMHLL